VAARLEQAAQPGEILIGEPTLALVRDAVETEPVEPLAVKGKADLVAAFRLVAGKDAAGRRHDVPMVGREHELASLRSTYDEAVRDRSCRLFTVVGAAGVGKPWVAYEFLNGVDARVVHGRCLSYGEGITYWPVVEVLKQLAALPSDPAAAVSLRSLLRLGVQARIGVNTGEVVTGAEERLATAVTSQKTTATVLRCSRSAGGPRAESRAVPHVPRLNRFRRGG
jgi:hypothetical protein